MTTKNRDPEAARARAPQDARCALKKLELYDKLAGLAREQEKYGRSVWYQKACTTLVNSLIAQGVVKT